MEKFIKTIKLMFSDNVYVMLFTSLICNGYILGEFIKLGSIFNILLVALSSMCILFASQIYITNKYEKKLNEIQGI